MNLQIGQTYQLTATINPAAADQRITWVSSNGNIASVNDGLITAKAEGTVYIVAKSTANLDVKNSAAVRIATAEAAAAAVPAKSIKLDQDKITLKVGETYRLTAAVSPEDATQKNVVWVSSNGAIASVANGLVTAKKAGTVYIVAKVEANLDIKASCAVEVK